MNHKFVTEFPKMFKWLHNFFKTTALCAVFSARLVFGSVMKRCLVLNITLC